MDMAAIRSHWHDWATQYGADLRATTKTNTIKQLELDAFTRALRAAGRTTGTVLEIGCGNGVNCLSLAQQFPALAFTGVDYVPEMITAAHQTLARQPELAKRVKFQVGNVLEMGTASDLAGHYDVVFTDRMVINLNTWELQARALDQLAAKVAPGGLLLMIENFTGCYGRQNELRVKAGLPPRQPASYNLFLEERQFEAHLGRTLKLVAAEDFAALHDLVLYVLGAVANKGEVDYANPLVQAATDLTLALQGSKPLGDFGQNRLYVFRRER